MTKHQNHQQRRSQNRNKNKGQPSSSSPLPSTISPSLTPPKSTPPKPSTISPPSTSTTFYQNIVTPILDNKSYETHNDIFCNSISSNSPNISHYNSSTTTVTDLAYLSTIPSQFKHYS